MEAVLQTVSPACAGDGEAIEIVRGLFQNYDLQYEIEELQNINVQGTEASLEVVQVTRKVAGPEFRDNRMRISHTLVKEDGEWKMCSSTFLIEDIEFLN